MIAYEKVLLQQKMKGKRQSFSALSIMRACLQTNWRHKTACIRPVWHNNNCSRTFYWSA